MKEFNFDQLNPIEKDTTIIIYYLDKMKEKGILAEGRFTLTETAVPLVEAAISDGHKISDANIALFCLNGNTASDAETAIALIQMLKECRDNGIDAVIADYERFIENG